MSSQYPTNPQYSQPPKKKHTVRNILLGIGAVFALLIAVSMAAGGGGESATNADPAPTATKSPDNGPSPDPVVTPTNAPTKPQAEKPAMTKSQEQAVGSARRYLEIGSFSRKGLIRQLSSDAGDGFPVADATFAADHLKVNWNEQAAKAAKKYLEISNFSRKGLIEQLQSDSGDGFTRAQAVYGVDKAGL